MADRLEDKPITEIEVNSNTTTQLFKYLSSEYAFLSQDFSNSNVTIVEVGRWRGTMTRAMRHHWQKSTIFSIDDGRIARLSDGQFTKSMMDMQELGVVAIQSTSPPNWPWPKSWNYDLLVLDITIDYKEIRNNVRWWTHSAKRYADGSKGIILASLPDTTAIRKVARETFLSEESWLDYKLIPFVDKWVILQGR